MSRLKHTHGRSYPRRITLYKLRLYLYRGSGDGRRRWIHFVCFVRIRVRKTTCIIYVSPSRNTKSTITRTHVQVECTMTLLYQTTARFVPVLIVPGIVITRRDVTRRPPRTGCDTTRFLGRPWSEYDARRPIA